MMKSRRVDPLVTILVLAVTINLGRGNPSSRPYIPFRTDPYDQPHVHHALDFVTDTVSTSRDARRMQIYEPERALPNDLCPLRFSLGVSRRSQDAAAPGLGGNGALTGNSASTPLGIQQPPVIYPILPWQGPGRQVLYATQYEHLDMLTPSKGSVHVGDEESEIGSASSPTGNKATFSKSFIAEGLVEHVEFPLLFESSAFQTSPVIGDVNKDGIIDAILTDYHGGIYAIGLQVPFDKKRRYFHKTQVPRLYVRRRWMESMVNETLGIDPYEAEKKAEEEAAAAERQAAEAAKNGTEPQPKDETKPIRAHDERPHDPYHSYFEYSYGATGEDHEPILRGVTADLLGQNQEHVEGLDQRRGRRVSYEREVVYDSVEEERKEEKVVYDSYEEEQKQQKVVYDSIEEEHDKEKVVYDSIEEEVEHEAVVYDSVEVDREQEKVVYDSVDKMESAEDAIGEHAEKNHRRLQEVSDVADAGESGAARDAEEGQQDSNVVLSSAGDDMLLSGGDDIYSGLFDGDEVTGEDKTVKDMRGSAADGGSGAERDASIPKVESEEFDDQVAVKGDDTYPRYDDYSRYDMYDDYYNGRYNSLHEDYYDDKHYVRLPPHILCTPVLVELPKLYSNTGEMENLLFVAVSYYFDEDEYEGFFSYKRFANSDHGDETETQRGMYVANALMIYHFGESPRWGRQEHLDLSGDHSAPVNVSLVGSIPLREDNTKLGAFALSSPTVADVDGDGSSEVLMGTSMGFLYVMDARNLFSKDGWPVQFQYGIENRVLVEDVRGDTNLEIFVSDVGGNIFCLDHKGNKIWQRDLLRSVTKDKGGEVLGTSPMVLGDVDGDGLLDIALLLKVRTAPNSFSRFLFVISAETGEDISNGKFPMHIWTKPDIKREENVGEDFVHEKLPPPLLVDMHGSQDHISDYIKRNGSKWFRSNNKQNQDNSVPPHGGSAGGLHIVQPIDAFLVIVEGGSGCTQTIEIGEDIMSMVQADDVHGTNRLDLVISTVSGNVVTLESEAPFHPLNVWNNGELRSRTNGAAHGYSASQGIFVHEVSRQFRDIFGVYVPVTFEIFDNRPNIRNEPDKRKYNVEIKEGTSRLVFRKDYTSPGVYTERLFIPYGPGYYELTVVLKTTHGLLYEDAFHIGYNVNYMDGFGMLLWLPLTIATVAIFLMGTKKVHWDDDDYQGDSRHGGQGILGNLPELTK